MIYALTKCFWQLEEQHRQLKSLNCIFWHSQATFSELTAEMSEYALLEIENFNKMGEKPNFESISVRKFHQSSLTPLYI